MEHKRDHQWLIDSDDAEILSSKKQTYEAGNERLPFGTIDTSLWHETGSFHPASGSFSGRLFESEDVNNMLVLEGNLASVGCRNIPLERISFSSQYGINSALGLPISLVGEDASEVLGCGGFRKTKACEVRDSHIDDPTFLDHSYDSSTMTALNSLTTNTVPLLPSYADAREMTISGVSTLCKDDGCDFISTGHTVSQTDRSSISISNYIKREDSVIAKPLDGADANFTSMASCCGHGEKNSVSLSSTYGKDDDHMISICSVAGKTNNSFRQGCPSYSKDDENAVIVSSTYDNADSITSVNSIQDNGDANTQSLGSNFYGNGINNISFNCHPNDCVRNSAGSIVGDYSSVPPIETANRVPSVIPHADFGVAKSASTYTHDQMPCSKSDSAKGKDSKGAKKAPANNFPSNVKSLLSTGMLDGVPVKYVSWSRERNLKGTIQGTRYLCGCNDCSFSKALNAYEFERHACCKTKHPNNHIYFDNGKTIYSVVQELKNTPQEMLFDAIQTVTGSPINQKNFRMWKASYQAATRELQRIYGKDEFSMPT